MDRRRAILILSATCTSLLAKPIEAFASAMPFSWYGSTLRLVSSAVVTPFKYYDGSSIGIEMTCSAARKGAFKVKCCDASGACLGSRMFAYQGFTKQTWRMPKPGNYQFVFSKMYDDRIVVSSTDVKMYSW